MGQGGRSKYRRGGQAFNCALYIGASDSDRDSDIDYSDTHRNQRVANPAASTHRDSCADSEYDRSPIAHTASTAAVCDPGSDPLDPHPTSGDRAHCGNAYTDYPGARRDSDAWTLPIIINPLRGEKGKMP